jgi:hypothetical protein
MNMLKFIHWGIMLELPRLLNGSRQSALKGILAMIAATGLIIFSLVSFIYGFLVDDLQLVLIGGAVLFILEFGLGWATRAVKSKDIGEE